MYVPLQIIFLIYLGLICEAGKEVKDSKKLVLKPQKRPGLCEL